jgi:hypothetical protein
MSPSDIAAATGLKSTIVGTTLHRMLKDNLVIRVGRAKWGLPKVDGDDDHTVISFGSRRPRQDPEKDDDE